MLSRIIDALIGLIRRLLGDRRRGTDNARADRPSQLGADYAEGERLSQRVSAGTGSSEAQAVVNSLRQEVLIQLATLHATLNSPNSYLDIKDLKPYSTLSSRITAVLTGPTSHRFNRRQKADLAALGGRVDSVPARRESHNAEYIKALAAKHQWLLSSVEGRALDGQQIECVLREDDNILVVAGAGSGKTLTILGKVKYLLQTGRCSPEDLLVLSFTNASAKEMRDRLLSETGKDLDVMTFHKLGLSIITEIEAKKPSITDLQLADVIREYLGKFLEDESYSSKFARFFISYRREYRSQFEFSRREAYEEETSRQRVTLNNERVKSHEEQEIADYLALNGVRYNYEHPYEVETADLDHRQYKPDFYLPDYGIYIEHFALSRSGDVPPFFTGRGEKTAKQVYTEGIEWKRSIHQLHKTMLVETYSYEKLEGTLLSNLQALLKRIGVKFDATPAKISSIVTRSGSDELAGITELISTFINLAKAADYSDVDLQGRAMSLFSGEPLARCRAFLEIALPISKAYNSLLKRRGEIDFNDMITKATEYVKDGRLGRQYKYIIIDEYQDISASRYRLVKALRDCSGAKLFCVGDDWQSIYRFSGSDVSFFLDFEYCWGPTQQCLIETTYRFTHSMIRMSSGFVLKNPQQIRKNLRSSRVAHRLSFDLLISKSEYYSNQDLKSKLQLLPQNSQVLLLGRYSQDISRLVSRDFCRGNDDTCVYDKRPDLHIRFLTIHKSKGLQDDYVFILNNKSGTLGFPSHVQDDSILSLVLARKEVYPFAEERRLFYVAVTRAREKVWLVGIEDQKSSFLAEIEREYGEEIKDQRTICPRCGGRLRYFKNGQYGPFWGCSNYKTHGCTYKTPRV